MKKISLYGRKGFLHSLRSVGMTICLLIFVIFMYKPNFILAQSSESFYQDLLAKYRTYQTNLEPYRTAKAKYTSYQSVISQAEYINTSKKLLTDENSAMLSYAKTVQSRLAEATSVLNYQENLFYIKLDDEISALSLEPVAITGISSLDDLKKTWSDIKSHFLSVSSYGYQTKSYIEIGSFDKIFENLKVVKEKVRSFIFDNTTSNTLEINAAKKMYNDLETNYSEIEGLLNKAKATQKGATVTVDFGPGSKSIRNQIDQAILKSESLLNSYQKIIDTLLNV